jgi:hypothetical protein
VVDADIVVSIVLMVVLFVLLDQIEYNTATGFRQGF